MIIPEKDFLEFLSNRRNHLRERYQLGLTGCISLTDLETLYSSLREFEVQFEKELALLPTPPAQPLPVKDSNPELSVEQNMTIDQKTNRGGRPRKNQ